VPKYEAHQALTGDLSRHPAVLAWALYRNAPIEPDSVTALKEHHTGKAGKSAVYRLARAGPAGEDVVAKRCQRQLAMIERTIYEDVLPCVPLPHLKYYGVFDEPQSESSWIFLQDAGTRAFSPDNAHHRAAAATWLGVVHTATQRLVGNPGLPNRQFDDYLGYLRTACGLICRYLDAESCTPANARGMQSIVRYAKGLERQWSRLRNACDAVPTTLVHGDFVARNIRLGLGDGSLVILPFDWECSCWGNPVIDLAQTSLGSTRFGADPDLRTYSLVVRDHWPNLNAQTVQRLALIGTLLRLLSAIYWAALGLPHEGAERSVRNLSVHAGGLDRVVRALDAGN
jgi:hypothetical protein